MNRLKVVLVVILLSTISIGCSGSSIEWGPYVPTPIYAVRALGETIEATATPPPVSPPQKPIPQGNPCSMEMQDKDTIEVADWVFQCFNGLVFGQPSANFVKGKPCKTTWHNLEDGQTEGNLVCRDGQLLLVGASELTADSRKRCPSIYPGTIPAPSSLNGKMVTVLKIELHGDEWANTCQLIQDENGQKYYLEGYLPRMVTCPFTHETPVDLSVVGKSYKLFWTAGILHNANWLATPNVKSVTQVNILYEKGRIERIVVVCQ